MELLWLQQVLQGEVTEPTAEVAAQDLAILEAMRIGEVPYF